MSVRRTFDREELFRRSANVNTKVEEEFRRVGDLFCSLLTEIRIEGMKRFMEDWKADRKDRALDTLRELSSIWEVAERICEQGGEKKGG